MQTRMREVKEAARHETRSFAFEVKASGNDGEIEGYASVFGLKDSYSDVVSPGAFTKSLDEHRAAATLPAMLWQHEDDEPIGVWTEMVEDARGLRVKGKIVLEADKGRSAFALLKAGALRGLSIGFMSKEWSFDEDTGIRTLTAVDLWEVSLVTFPAQKEAVIDSIKAAVDEIGAPKDAEKILREAGFSKADATSLVSRMMRMGEERREAANATSQATRAAERLLSLLSQKD
jgi:uncharacterized protein